jgi:hypothetical protein
MSDTYEDVEAPFSATFRTGAGYDAALLTVRGNDASQFVARLTELQLEDQDVLKLVADFNRALQEKAGAAPQGAPSGNRSTGSPSRSGSRSSAGAAPQNSEIRGEVEYHPEGLACSKCNGSVIYKKITAKNGKRFELWVCENQKERNDGHHSEFIN